MEGAADKGMRISIGAERLIAEHTISREELLSLKKTLITEKDIAPILEKRKREEPPEVVIKRSADFKPPAKEYEPELKFHDSTDVTGKSRTGGTVEDFVSYFRNRYEKLSRMLRTYSSKYPEADLSEVKSHEGEKIKIVVMVTELSTTKNGNLLARVEDLTGRWKIVFSSKYEEMFQKAKTIVRDDVIAVYGKALDAFLIAEDFEWPDLPVSREEKKGERDLAAAYISDIHFGSDKFLPEYLDSFREWLEGNGSNPELAGKVKYVFVAGDIVDGIGIYPNQEQELTERDIFKQYEMFDAFAQSLPDYIEMIVGPGNHDAVRRGEPMPAISNEIIKSNVKLIGSPACVSVDSFEHLIYHGTSVDSWIATVPRLSYDKPEKVMVEALKRRHLSPSFGGNAIVPERLDYLVIEREPDILHFGHVHKNGYTKYRGTTIINSGTFQATTPFQKKQGHIPTPGKVPVFEFMHQQLRTLDFTR